MFWDIVNSYRKGGSDPDSDSDNETNETIDIIEETNKKINIKHVLNNLNGDPVHFLNVIKLNKEVKNVNILKINRNFIYEFKTKLEYGIRKDGYYTYNDYKKSFDMLVNYEIVKKNSIDINNIGKLIHHNNYQRRRLNNLVRVNVGLTLLLCFVVLFKNTY